MYNGECTVDVSVLVWKTALYSIYMLTCTEVLMPSNCSYRLSKFTPYPMLRIVVVFGP